jgi:hypothetical protein
MHTNNKPIFGRQSDIEDPLEWYSVYFLSITPSYRKRSRFRSESVPCHLVFLHTWTDVRDDRAELGHPNLEILGEVTWRKDRHASEIVPQVDGSY